MSASSGCAVHSRPQSAHDADLEPRTAESPDQREWPGSGSPILTGKRDSQWRPNDLQKMPIDYSIRFFYGLIVRVRAQTTLAASRAPGKKSAPNKKKRRNRIEELAKILNISRSSMYSYAKQGLIPCGWAGNRYLIPDDVEERLRSLAYENWRSRYEKRQRQHEEGSGRAAVLGAGSSSPTTANRRRTGSVWLSPRQFARRFGVGTSAVYGAVDRGEVPAIRIGRHIRIPPDAVETILHHITDDHSDCS